MKQIQRLLNSREVAEMVEKQHKNLLSDIRGYVDELAGLKIQPSDFFQNSTYQDKNNRHRPCYLITKKGCEFIAHKLTGTKGTEFTAKYINRFHEMEQELADPRKMSVLEQIQLLALGNGELVQRIDNVEKGIQEIKQDLPLFAVECERITKAVKKKGITCLGGKDSNAYNDKSLRSKVYRDIHNELKRQFEIDTYKALKRSQCNIAFDIIANYQCPYSLLQAIEDCNKQKNLQFR